MACCDVYVSDGFSPAAGVAGWRRLRPSTERRFNLRFFALFTPIVMYTIYFLTLALTDQIWWRMHTVTGLILMSGFVGLFVSYLVFPPRSQVEIVP